MLLVNFLGILSEKVIFQGLFLNHSIFIILGRGGEGRGGGITIFFSNFSGKFPGNFLG